MNLSSEGTADYNIYKMVLLCYSRWIIDSSVLFRVQRKSFLQLAIRASWSKHLLAQTSFKLAPKIFGWAELMSWFLCKLNSLKYFTCPSGKLRTEFTILVAQSTSPGLSDTTFLARCCFMLWTCPLSQATGLFWIIYFIGYWCKHERKL